MLYFLRIVFSVPQVVHVNTGNIMKYLASSQNVNNISYNEKGQLNVCIFQKLHLKAN